MINNGGASAVQSHTVVLGSLPTAPIMGSAVGGAGQATVNWTVAANGGAPLTGFTITPYFTSDLGNALPTVTTSDRRVLEHSLIPRRGH